MIISMMSVDWHTEVSSESCGFYDSKEFPKFLLKREGILIKEAPTKQR